MIAIAFGLRLGRWGLAGFSLAGLVSTLISTLAFYQVAGHTPAERAAFGQSMTRLAAQFVALLPPPVQPETVGGYIEFRGFHPLAILFAVWALASATAFVRADEERGIVEAALAAGIARISLIAARTACFAIAVAVASTVAATGFLIGVALGHESVELRGVIEESALLASIGLACYALSLLVAQLTAARIATAAAGVLLLALFFVNSLGREFDWLSGWRRISPFWYYDLSQPLPPGGHFDTGGVAALLAIAIAATGAAAVVFALRDLGAPLVRVPVSRDRPSLSATATPLWTIPVVRGIYDHRGGLLVWCAGMAALAVLFVSLTKTIVQVLLSLPAVLPYLSLLVRQQVYPAVLGYTWFNVAQLLFAALAIAYVARWSAEDTDGRLEMMLSEPFSRAAIVIERMAVLVVGGLLIAAVSAGAVYFASRSQGIELNIGRLAIASLMLVPFALVFAGAGSMLAAWNPRAAVGVLGGLAFASYLDNELGAIFNLPLWLRDLSAFTLFGTPLVDGIDARNLTLMLLLALAGVATSILFMQRRDVGA